MLRLPVSTFPHCSAVIEEDGPDHWPGAHARTCTQKGEWLFLKLKLARTFCLCSLSRTAAQAVPT